MLAVERYRNAHARSLTTANGPAQFGTSVLTATHGTRTRRQRRMPSENGACPVSVSAGGAGAGGRLLVASGFDTPRSGGRLELLRQQLLGHWSPSRDVRACPSTKKGVAMAIVDSARPVVGGVDTHRDRHVAAVVDMNGGLLGVESFPRPPPGIAGLSSWMRRVRHDRTGRDRGHRRVWGRPRPPSSRGRCGGDRGRSTEPAETPPQRQERPARRDRSGAWRVVGSLRRRRPKTGDGHAEALRALLVAKRSAHSTRIRTIVQLRHLMFTAPDELRARCAKLSRNDSWSTRPPICAHAPVADVACTRDQDRSGDPGAPGPGPRRRARRDRRADRPARQSRRTGTVEHLRRRRRHRRRAARHRRRQPGTDPLRSGVGDAVRHRADPGEQRQDAPTGTGSTTPATATPTTPSGGS